MTLATILSSFSFFDIIAHIHDMVPIYVSKCSPFNLLSNCMFYLATHVFIYEVQVEMYHYSPDIVYVAKKQQHKVLIE